MLLGFRNDSQNKGYLNTPKMEVGIEIWRNIHIYPVVWLSDVFLWLIIKIITDNRGLCSYNGFNISKQKSASFFPQPRKQSNFPRYWNTLQLLKLWHQKKWYVGSEIRISGNKHQLCPSAATFGRTDESIRSTKAGFGVFCPTYEYLPLHSSQNLV